MTEPEPTIFDRILDGSIPCYKIFEDQWVLAFLDIAPLSKGHTLIIPKERKAFVHELSEATAAAVGRALPRVARAIIQVTGVSAYNVLQNNGAQAHQAVLHVHFHIIPRTSSDGLDLTWRPGHLSQEQGAILVKDIQAALEHDAHAQG